MLIYYGACVISIFIYTLTSKPNTSLLFQKKSASIFLSALPLFLLSALRWNVGTDFMTYYNRVEYVCRFKVDSGYEYFINFIISIIPKFGLDPQFFFVITSFAFVYLCYIQMYQDSPDIALSIFLFVCGTHYFISLNAVRQFLGCAILLFSIRYIEKRNLFKFLICVFLATGCHYTCLVFIFVYFMSILKWSPAKLLVASGFIAVFNTYISSLVLSVIEKTKYGWYIGSAFDNGEGYYISFAIQVVILILATVGFDKNNLKYRIYYCIQSISAWIGAFSPSIVLARRIRWMFALASIILIPLALNNIKDRRIRLFIRIATVLLFLVYSYYTIGIKHVHDAVPYRTIFEILI